MSSSKLSVFASLALAASAVLIPPTISADDFGDDHSLETFAINPFKRSVALECPGCDFAIQEETSRSWKQGVGNAFKLDFEIGSHEDTFEIDNGYQLYPPNFDVALTPFHVTQIDPSTDDNLRLQVTGFRFRFDGAETVSEDGTELLPMTLEIVSVEEKPVDLPALTIHVLKDSSGRLMIASFETTQASEATPVTQEKECNEWPLLCKWKGIAADRIEQMKKMSKGCHERPHSHHNPMEEDMMEGKPPHGFRPGRPHPHPHHGPHHGHKGHGHHHPHHRMHMFARRAFFTILIPVIIGIFAGTVTYLIGMVLGTLIAIVIAKARGQSYQKIALEDNYEEGEAEVESEKENYAELPAYDAPPTYEEAPEKEVV